MTFPVGFLPRNQWDRVQTFFSRTTEPRSSPNSTQKSGICDWAKSVVAYVEGLIYSRRNCSFDVHSHESSTSSEGVLVLFLSWLLGWHDSWAPDSWAPTIEPPDSWTPDIWASDTWALTQMRVSMSVVEDDSEGVGNSIFLTTSSWSSLRSHTQTFNLPPNVIYIEAQVSGAHTSGGSTVEAHLSQA